MSPRPKPPPNGGFCTSRGTCPASANVSSALTCCVASTSSFGHSHVSYTLQYKLPRRFECECLRKSNTSTIACKVYRV